jgi:hypothetical protein
MVDQERKEVRANKAQRRGYNSNGYRQHNLGKGNRQIRKTQGQVNSKLLETVLINTHPMHRAHGGQAGVTG